MKLGGLKSFGTPTFILLKIIKVLKTKIIGTSNL